MNLVFDDAKETLKNATERSFGTTVCRGTSVMLVSPEDGYEEIANPFLQVEGGEE